MSPDLDHKAARQELEILRDEIYQAERPIVLDFIRQLQRAQDGG